MFPYLACQLEGAILQAEDIEGLHSAEDCKLVWPHICDYADEVQGDSEKLKSLKGRQLQVLSLVHYQA